MSSSKIAIIDYDAGNIKSVERAIAYCGGEAILTRDPKVLMYSPKVILPGVGSFGDAMDKLKKYDLIDTIHDYVKTGKPFLGICLGLQLLFDGSDESPEAKGLGLLEGYIHKIPDNLGLKVPQIGWNSLDYPNKGRLFEGIPEGSFVYFVHSYYLKAEDVSVVKATSEYMTTFHASVESGNVFACQFHPEKSSDVGLAILKNFVEMD